MKNFTKLIGIIVTLAVIGFSFAACDNGSTGGGLSGVIVPGGTKYLIINHISQAQYDASDTSYEIGIYKAGISKAEAWAWEGLVAGADWDDITISGSGDNHVITVPLYSFPFGYNARWTGSGTYDIFAKLNSSNQGFVKRNVSITSETTYLDAKSVDEEF